MTQHNSTNINKKETNLINGLSPAQEKAIVLLLSGKSITDISRELNVDRTTIYLWQEKETFQAYYNFLAKKIKIETEGNLLGIYNDAIQVVKDSLHSDNESIKLKSALWLIDRIDNQEIGEPNPIELIKSKCMESTLDWNTESLNEEKFSKMIQENNLDINHNI